MPLTLLIPCPDQPPPITPKLPHLLIGPNVPSSHPPHHIRTRGTRTELINTGLDHLSSTHILIANPTDLLDESALSTAPLPSPDSSLVLNYRFTSPIGDLPTPVGSTPTLPVTLDAFLRHVPPFILFSRSAVGDFRPHSAFPEAELLLHLASRNHTFASSSSILARRPLNPLTDFDTTLRDLAARICLLADTLSAMGREHELESAAADYIDAIIVLRAHQRAIADRGTAHLATATRFPFLYSQWWHRCGFFGPAPRHILTANGGLAESISTDPGLIAQRMLSFCPRSAKPPILLGLGRNARAVARALHSAGRPVIGHDDSGAVPAWSKEDSIPVQLHSGNFDPSQTYLMTVLNDDAYLARLPQNLNIIRWREMPALILAEWRASALQWALRSAPVSTAFQPALAGAF